MRRVRKLAGVVAPGGLTRVEHGGRDLKPGSLHLEETWVDGGLGVVVVS